MTGSVSNGLMPPEPERSAPSQYSGRRRDGRPPAASRSTKHPPTADRLHRAASYSDEEPLEDFGQTRRHPPARDTTSHGPPPPANPMHINAPQSGPEYGRRRRPTPHPDVVGVDVAPASEAPPGPGPPGRDIGLDDIAELPKDGAHAHFRDEPVTAEVPDHRGNYPPPAIRATRSTDRKRRPTPHPNAIPDAPPRRDVINPFSDSGSETETGDRHGRGQHQQEVRYEAMHVMLTTYTLSAHALLIVYSYAGLLLFHLVLIKICFCTFADKGITAIATSMARGAPSSTPRAAGSRGCRQTGDKCHGCGAEGCRSVASRGAAPGAGSTVAGG